MIRNGGGRKVVDPKYWNEWWSQNTGMGAPANEGDELEVKR